MIELLVVISILGLLVSLLLPAVQQVRETARRIECSSHLHQIGIALHNYHSTHNIFPLNYGSGPYDDRNTGISWLAMTLPYIEQKPLYDQIDFGYSAGTAANVAVSRTVVPMLLCPSDSHGTGVMPNRRNTDAEQAITNYKACLGSNWNWGLWSPRSSPTGRNAGSTNGLDECNGLICRGGDLPPTRTRFRDVTDGLSNTFAAGEAVPEWTWHTWWYWFNASTATCAIPLNWWNRPESSMIDWHDNYAFASRHPGGGHFLMGDNHIDFVSENINLSVYQRRATIQGGEVDAAGP